MNDCIQCLPTEPIYEIKLNSSNNVEVAEQVIAFMNEQGSLVQLHEDILSLRESRVADFYDFCIDHMNADKISFRAKDRARAWQPIAEILHELDDRWIDPIITNDQVVSYAQPIVDGEGNVYGHEMLARFMKQDGELVSPFEVFSAAKRRNRLYSLDRMCRMSAVRTAAHLPARVFINFIPTSIYSPQHCLQSTIALSQELGLDPAKFVFEVVESEQVDDLEHLRNILQYYKGQGFSYALDDVGEGFSTVELLKDIKPHYMKLDKSYVHRVVRDEQKKGMALQMLEAALDIGAVPLAEGVEAEEDFLWLKDQGYQLFQGYLFGKPAPVAV